MRRIMIVAVALIATAGAITFGQRDGGPSPRIQLEKIKLPPGFHISVWAEGVRNARSLAQSPSGTIFVGTQGAGNVYALRDDNKDGKADKVITVASGLATPNGVAFRDGSLYVAEVNRVLRFDKIEPGLAATGAPVVVSDKFPPDKHHGWKFIRFGPDGMLYVPVGAPCNICDRGDPYATIWRMKPDGSGLEIFARGVRNTVGFDWHPTTKEMWFTDNGRDNLGDDLPGDELNRVSKAGLHFGYPYCHQGTIVDPELGAQRQCNGFEAPAQRLLPHAAAVGMRFYTGTQFPEAYRNSIFIAEHGSWNRSPGVAYNGNRVSIVKLDASGKVLSYEPFAEGWLTNRVRWGRPVDLEVLPDGSLLVSDDQTGVIYRITYTGK